MQKTKDTDNSIGYNSCSCGEYIYSINKRRIRVAVGNYVTYYPATEELEIKCRRCNEVTVIKVKKCMA